MNGNPQNILQNLDTTSIVIIIGAIGAQILLIIGAIFTGMMTWRTKTSVDETKKETITQTPKIQQIAEKSAVIEGHVNSNEARYHERVASLERENALLREFLSQRQQDAALLAQAQAARTRQTDTRPTTKE